MPAVQDQCGVFRSAPVRWEVQASWYFFQALLYSKQADRSRTDGVARTVEPIAVTEREMGEGRHPSKRVAGRVSSSRRSGSRAFPRLHRRQV